MGAMDYLYHQAIVSIHHPYHTDRSGSSMLPPFVAIPQLVGSQQWICLSFTPFNIFILSTNWWSKIRLFPSLTSCCNPIRPLVIEQSPIRYQCKLYHIPFYIIHDIYIIPKIHLTTTKFAHIYIIHHLPFLLTFSLFPYRFCWKYRSPLFE